jgi:Tol biopolymer transport system component
VIATLGGLVVAEVDGSGSRIVFGGPNQSMNPSWSHDGGTIASRRGTAPAT